MPRPQPNLYSARQTHPSRVLVLCMLLVLMLTALAFNPARAGVMTRETLTKRFPSPLIIGDKDAALPVWPIFKKNMTSTDLVAYVFESVDFAPIPGFSGVPMNLLVALDPSGSFMDVQVLSHHEPVFLDGLGDAPLLKFVSQYKDLSLKQNLKIVTGNSSGVKKEGANVYLDGVSKATASVRIINQSVLSAALKVARKKLGFAEGRDPDLIARIDEKKFDVASADQLVQQALVKHVVVSNRTVDQSFADSAAARLDPEALAKPDAAFVELDLSLVSVPTVGRNLLGDAGWNRLKDRLEPGDHAVMLVSRGRYGIVGDDFVHGSVPDRLALKQGTLPIEIRDLDLDLTISGERPKPESMKIFRIISQSGLDPSLPLEFYLHVTRSKGIVYPEKISRDVRFEYSLPAKFYVAAQADNKTWHGIWLGRWWEIAILLVALALLSIALGMQKKLVADDRRFIWFRRGFLTFTTLFIGWYAQGQLSIVNFTGVLQALLQHRSLEFLLYDPMTVTLWAFVFISLFIWGRGTFCGWLCPFGALQELTGKLAQALKVPQLMIRRSTDARLKLLKYVVLAGILGSAVFSPELTDKLVEIEPFKTAITLNFVRSWPFVLYAGALLVASMFVYKFFCRFLCPFGAGLAILGRIRLLDWLPRRAECGKPCQTCRHRCEYEAIRPNGTIQYEDCFQCLDCVVIYESDEKCAPLIMEKKRLRSIPIVPVAQVN